MESLASPRVAFTDLPDALPEDEVILSYSDTTPYEEQKESLANRIGKTKVYLLEEEFSSRKKRKRSVSRSPTPELDVDMSVLADGDPNERSNAILLVGPPISTLPTFGVTPLGLEWINDETCVLVFDGRGKAAKAFAALAKTQGEAPDEDGFMLAHNIPLTLLPPEERISQTLLAPSEPSAYTKARGLIRMRWALATDVKKRGAKRESEFYKRKRRRRGEDLDLELDNFLDDHSPEPEPEPILASRMRSDYIASDGRTLLERTSVIRAIDGVPGRVYSDGSGDRRRRDGEGRDRRRRGGRGRRPREGDEKERGGRERPKKSQQELDDELDAFLKEGE
ncbi:hypothetical protein CPB85DRAFT_1351892 [Mucidula mucida]|nr:hypothetical protein CPB85DRAFT_1351892 [Mucidula mucida]